MSKKLEYAKCIAVLCKIKDMGIINDKEFAAAKNKLMDRYLILKTDTSL